MPSLRSGSPISPGSPGSPRPLPEGGASPAPPRTSPTPGIPAPGPEAGIPAPAPHSRLGVWIHAARPLTLPASVSPVLVASAAALGEGRFRPGVFLAALVAAVLIQVGANFANDLFDFKKGADTAARTGPVRVTQAGLLSEREVAAGTAVVLSLAFLVGLYLVWVGGWPILVVGLASLAGAIAYTGGPWPLGYHGLGDLFVFIFFGLVAVVTTYYLHTGEAGLFAFTLAVPVGLIVTNILVVNNLRDIDTDRAAGKRTVAVRIGERATRIQYVLFLVVAYAVPIALGLAGRIGPLGWLPLLSLPLAYRLSRAVLGGTSGAALNRVLKGTGQLLLLFSVLLGLGLVGGRLP